MSVIVFSSFAGGVGCSTTVAHCANLMQNSGKPTIAIDLCRSNGLSVAMAFDEIPLYGWSSYAHISEISNHVVFELDNGLKFIPHGSIEKINKEKIDINDLFGALLNKNIHILLDVGHDIYSQRKILNNQSDLNLLIAKADISSFLQIKNNIGFFKKNEKPFKIIVNRYDPRRPGQRDILKKMLSEWGNLIIQDIVHEDELLSESINNSFFVNDRHPHSQSAHDIVGVFNSIEKVLLEKTSYASIYS